jgi:hypothetical protein
LNQEGRFSGSDTSIVCKTRTTDVISLHAVPVRPPHSDRNA